MFRLVQLRPIMTDIGQAPGKRDLICPVASGHPESTYRETLICHVAHSAVRLLDINTLLPISSRSARDGISTEAPCVSSTSPPPLSTVCVCARARAPGRCLPFPREAETGGGRGSGAKGAWRNGSASDSRSEGWEFESLSGHFISLSLFRQLVLKIGGQNDSGRV